MQPTKKARIDGPDILRGFAAISVIVVHLIASSGINYGHFITLIGQKFTASVTLFFAISAFSIAYSYNENLINKVDFKNFFIKRFFRLAPLFYVALIVEGIIIFHAFNHLPTLFEVLMSGTFLFNLVPKMQNGIVWAGWSLSIEWIFYLLYPIIFIICNNKKTVLFIWIICIFISTSTAKVSAEPIEIYMNILNHMVFFVSGIAVYLFLPEIKKLKELLRKYASTVSGLILASSFVLLIYCFSQNGYPINIYFFYSLLWIFMISASILGIPSIINTKFTRFLGKASYSIYLMHSIVLYLLEASRFYKIIDNLNIISPVKFIISLLITAGVTVMVSYTTYKFIEEPGINFGRKFLIRKT